MDTALHARGEPAQTGASDQNGQSKKTKTWKTDSPVNEHLKRISFSLAEDPGLAAVVSGRYDKKFGHFFSEYYPAPFEYRAYYYQLQFPVTERDNPIFWLREWYPIVSLEYTMTGDDCRLIQESDPGSSLPLDLKAFSRWPLIPVAYTNSGGGQCTLWIRADAPVLSGAQIFYTSAGQFIQNENTERIIAAGFLMILSILFLYNLLLYFMLRQKVFLAYLFFLFATFVYQFYMSGFTYDLARTLGPGAHHLFYLSTVWLTAIIPFYRYAVPEARGSRVTQSMMVFFYFHMTLVVAGFFLPPMDSLVIAFVPIALISHLLIFLVAAYHSYRGYRSARLFLAAYSVYLVLNSFTLFIDVLAMGPHYYRYLTVIQQGASLSELILFSLLLSDRYIQFQREKEKADARLIETQKQSLEEMKSLDRLKDRFLANTSHELRTPLHGIIGLSEQIEELSSTAELKDSAHLIRHTAQRLSRLIDDILDISRIKNSDLRLERRPVQACSVLHGIGSLYRRRLSEKGLSLDIHCPEDSLILDVDPDRFEQVLYNLTGNAATHAPEGSAIRIEIRRDQKGPENARLTVRNQITQEEGDFSGRDREPELNADNVFEPFVRSAGSHRGLGLGLAIVREIARLHGGDAFLERAAPGPGERMDHVDPEFVISVVLPLAMQSGQALQESEPYTATEAIPGSPRSAPLPVNRPETFPETGAQEDGPSSTGPHESILVVEDDELNRELLRGILSQYSVYFASTGEEGLSILKEGSGFEPGFVIVDLMLPGISGIDVCREIRRNYGHRDIPVLMITARNRPEDMAEGLNAGATDFLPRPFEKEEILSRIGNIMQLQGLRKMTDSLSRSMSERLMEETERIYRDLHDHLGARLVDMKIQLERAIVTLPDEHQSTLNSLQQTLRAASDSLKSHVRDIETISLFAEDLPSGSQLYLQKRYEGSERNLDFNYTENFAHAVGGEKSMLYAGKLFPIFAEVASNDLKYGVGAARWDLEATEQYMRILFQSRTRYNDPAVAVERGTGKGSSSIRFRAEELGGQVNVYVSSDHFFRMQIQIPLSA